MGSVSKTYATIGFLVPRVANARNMPRQNRPALNIASFVGGLKAAPQFARGLAGLGHTRFTATGHYMQLASAARERTPSLS